MEINFTDLSITVEDRPADEDHYAPEAIGVPCGECTKCSACSVCSDCSACSECSECTAKTCACGTNCTQCTGTGTKTCQGAARKVKDEDLGELLRALSAAGLA